MRLTLVGACLILAAMAGAAGSDAALPTYGDDVVAYDTESPDTEGHVRANTAAMPDYYDDYPVIAAFAEALREGDEDTRLYYIEEELSGMRLRPLVPVLVDLLESRDDRQRLEIEYICTLLGLTGDPRAADALARLAVESDDWVLQRTGSWNLGLLPGETVEDYLISSVADESRARARGAAWALASLRAERAMETLKALMLREEGPPAPAVGFAISRIQGPSSRDFLIEQLSSPNPRTREAAAYGLLWRSNYQAVGPLAERLVEDDDECVRMQAAQTLGVIGGAEAAEALQQALDDQSAYVRYSAADVLVDIDGRHKSAARLTAALEDVSDGVRVAVASALADVDGDGVTEALVGVLQEDHHTYSRFAAAGALGERGDPKAVQPLIEALQDDDADVRGEAARALGHLGDVEAVEPLIAAFDDPEIWAARSAVDAVGRIGSTKAVPHLAGLLENGPGDLQWEVTEALGRIGGTEAFDALIEALKNGNYSAIDALGELGDPRAIPVLLDHLDVLDAGKAIGKCGDESVVPELIERMRNPTGEELRQATIALGYIGGEQSVSGLIAVSRSSVFILRMPAIQALGWTGEPAALDAVLFALENDPRQAVRLAAAGAVGRIGGERALPILLEKLHDENFSVREGAAKGLGHLGDTAGVEPLIEALEDENGLVRRAAAKALGRLGDPRAVEPLEKMLWDTYAGPAAAEALEQIERQ